MQSRINFDGSDPLLALPESSRKLGGFADSKLETREALLHIAERLARREVVLIPVDRRVERGSKVQTQLLAPGMVLELLLEVVSVGHVDHHRFARVVSREPDDANKLMKLLGSDRAA